MKNDDSNTKQEEIERYKKVSDEFFSFDEDAVIEAIIRAPYEYASSEEEHQENMKMLRYLETKKK